MKSENIMFFSLLFSAQTVEKEKQCQIKLLILSISDYGGFSECSEVFIIFHLVYHEWCDDIFLGFGILVRGVVIIDSCGRCFFRYQRFKKYLCCFNP